MESGLGGPVDVRGNRNSSGFVGAMLESRDSWAENARVYPISPSFSRICRCRASLQKLHNLKVTMTFLRTFDNFCFSLLLLLLGKPTLKYHPHQINYRTAKIVFGN